MDSQERKSFVFTAKSGVWSDDPTNGLRVPDDYCSDMKNFLFYNGTALTRAGINEQGILPGKECLFGKNVVRFGQSYPVFGIGSPQRASTTYDLIVCRNDYYLAQYDDVSQLLITDHVLPFGLEDTFEINSIQDGCFTSAVQDLIIGGDKLSGGKLKPGLHKIALIGTLPGFRTWEALADDQQWYFVLGHSTRLFVARQLSAGVPGFYSVGWTAVGTNDDFTSFGSGYVTLVDTFDTITGLVQIRNQVVICREGGFTIASLTGQSDPAYRLDNFSIDSQIGPKFSSTVASDGLVCFYVGEDDVYSFNLSQITPIGQPVSKQILDAVALTCYRGQIVHSNDRDRRRFYILSPMGVANDATPVFVYDIKVQTWAIWKYAVDTCGGIWSLGNGAYGNVTRQDDWLLASFTFANKLHVQQKEIPIESEAFLKFGPTQVGRISSDYRCLNNFLSVFVEGSPVDVSLEVQCRGGVRNELITNIYTESLLAQLPGEPPQRAVFKIDQVGNYYSFKFVFPAGATIRFDRFEVEFTESGELR